MKNFKLNDTVKIDYRNENENYDKFRGIKLVITHVARNQNEHPGFDSGVGDHLYDLKVKETGEDVPFSLYTYELQTA